MKILVTRFAAIGDCVMTAWAVTALRKAMSESNIVWAVQERCSPVIDTNLLVNKLQVFPRETWKKNRWSPKTWQDQLVKYTSLRKEKFDVGFDFQGHSKTALCMKLAGCTERYASRATDAFAKLLTAPSLEYKYSKHEVLNAMDLVRLKFGVELPDSCLMPKYDVESPIVDVVIQTGAGESDKMYPSEHWKQVAEELISKGHKVAAIGGKYDPHLLVDNHLDLVGEVPLPNAIEVIRKAKIHVSGDTGTAHIAAALGVPTVTIFGRTDPARFRPWGAPSTVLRDENSLANITPEQVIEGCFSAMKEHHSAIPH